MVNRKGLAKGKGSGYKNIIAKDPKVHSDSAKGRKQPQKIPKVGVIIPSKADMPVKDIEFDESVEVEEFKPETKASKLKRFAVEEFKVGKSFAQSKLEQLKKKREKERIEELEEINHPLVKEFERQKARVEELKTQISENEDEDKESKLFDELGKEQEQLREKQEKITDLDVEDLSDRELKTLAIRWKDTSLFGSNNKYAEELQRRIRAEKIIEKMLDDARKEKIEDEFSIFD